MAEMLSSRPLQPTIELPSQPVIEPKHTFTLLARVAEKLFALPSPPSEQSVKSEDLSRISHDTSLTETSAASASKHPSDVDTAATSIVLVPTMFSMQKVYVAPFEPIDIDLEMIWEQDIRERLCNVLKHEITTGTHVQEFMMAGRKTNALMPTILVTAADIRTKKRVERALKGRTLKWLRELAKVQKLQLVAAVEATSMSSACKPLQGKLDSVFWSHHPLAVMIIWLVIVIGATVCVVTGSSSRVPNSRLIAAPHTGTETQLFSPIAVRSTTTSHGTSPGNNVVRRTPSTNHTALIVGCVVGVVAFSFVLLASWYLMVLRRKNAKQRLAGDKFSPMSECSFGPVSCNKKSGAELDSFNQLNLTRSMAYMPTRPCLPIYENVHQLPSEPNYEMPGTIPDMDLGTVARNSVTVANDHKPQKDVVSTYCGQNLQLSGGVGLCEESCTLGGLVTIKGVVYGATVYHPFSGESTATFTQSTVEEDPFWYCPEDNIDDVDDAVQNNSPKLDHGLPDVSTSAPVEHIQDAVTMALPGPILRTHSNSSKALQVHVSSTTPGTSFSSRVVKWSIGTDWALLALPGDRQVLSNILRCDPNSADVIVNEIAVGIMQGPVHVMCGTYAKSGRLRSWISTLQHNLTTYKVQMLSLDEPLSMGCSGSWVVVGNRLCGHIIAIRHNVPWAYMVPIQDTLQDMRLSIGTDDISLSVVATGNHSFG